MYWAAIYYILLGACSHSRACIIKSVCNAMTLTIAVARARHRMSHTLDSRVHAAAGGWVREQTARANGWYELLLMNAIHMNVLLFIVFHAQNCFVFECVYWVSSRENQFVVEQTIKSVLNNMKEKTKADCFSSSHSELCSAACIFLVFVLFDTPRRVRGIDTSISHFNFECSRHAAQAHTHSTQHTLTRITFRRP